MGWRLSAHSGSKVSEIHPASQTCFLPVLISGKMPKQLGDELSIYLFNTNASFFDLVKSGMKGKVNPGIFKANPSDFSQKYLDTEKVLITTVTHTEDMSTYFDFWDVAKEEEMQVPDQKSRSFQVVSMQLCLPAGNPPKIHSCVKERGIGGGQPKDPETTLCF
ncbi:uncharacterized protein LOC114057791 isoform X2 [Empidonax traillii]|uniref:uncharacterized protein LOC114057791 isoform X2 n=1 Tax=Empidonax traillii TaxID=164674 RepID=UPI000FFD4EAC|nr:uncharacterized protein LOC114057791 isoform X2 [Empidonax traillii]